MIILSLYLIVVLLVIWLAVFILGKIIGMPIHGIVDIINKIRK